MGKQKKKQKEAKFISKTYKFSIFLSFVFISFENSVAPSTFFYSFFLFLSFAFLDLSPSELSSSSSQSSYGDGAPTLHLIAYSVNQKGRSEPTVLEDIAINEAEKRTGTYFVCIILHLQCFWFEVESKFINI